MRQCPFCEFDSGEMQLTEGRCPQCGSVIEWNDYEEAKPELVPVRTQHTTTNVASTEPAPAQPALPTPDPSFDLKSGQIESSGNADDSVKKPVDTSGQSDSQKLEELWRDSIVSDSNVFCTIKSSKAEATVSDSAFSIQRREIRDAKDPAIIGADYEILEKIGTGGVGVVYSARQASIDRTVAIKMLRDEYGNRAEHQDKFLAEAVLTGELDHPNIVPIYDLGRSKSGELFYSMKNVVGTPWDRVLSQKNLLENLEILMKVIDAISFAHSRGIVHRDLKPENVMLGGYGEVLVMDWGIALPSEGFRKSSSIMRSQAMGGTPAYMAPEMAKGPIESIGFASDVYLLGAILFEILAGYPPHHGRDVMECVRNASKNIIQPTEVTGELMEIAIKAMATIPARRFRTVQSFRDSIRLYQSHIESLTLSENAEVELKDACISQDYQEFSRAIFAFEEAISLWDENTMAKDGLLRAKTEYAKASLKNGDYDLGLSLLDENDHLDQPIIKKLRDAQKERDTRQSRFRAIRKLAVGLTAFILIAGTIALGFILFLFSNLTSAQFRLKEQVKKAEEAVVDAQDQKEKAEGQKAIAVQEQAKAEQLKEIAEGRRREAEQSKLETILQKEKAEESSYFAETGLVGASIEQNSFSIAADILDRQAASPAKSKLRHWEWGRYKYLVQGGSKEAPVPAVNQHDVRESVTSLRFFRNDKWVAVALATGEVELWRQGDQKPTFLFRHGVSVNDMDVDPTGQHIATCGLDEERNSVVKVWRFDEIQAPLLAKSFASKKSSLETIAFSELDGRYLAFGGNQRIGRVLDWRADKEVSVLLGHIDTIKQIRFSPDDKLVITGGIDGTIRIWNLKNGREIQRFSEHQRPVYAVAFDPTGKKVASAGADRRILIWEVAPRSDQNEEVEEIRKRVKGESVAPQSYQSLEGHSGTILDLCFSKDGKRLASVGKDNLVMVWELDDLTKPASISEQPEKTKQSGKTERLKLRGHGSWVNSVGFSTDGTKVISGADDRTWRTWNLARYKEKEVIGSGRVPILDAAFTPDGKSVVTAFEDGTIGLWDGQTGQQLASLSQGHEYLTNRAMLIPESNRLITSGGDNTLRIWDVELGSQRTIKEHTGRNAIFNVSKNGRWLVAGGDESGVGVWNIETNEALPRFRAFQREKTPGVVPMNAEPTAVAISEDGNRVFVGDKNGKCEFWNANAGEQIAVISGHSESIVACYFLSMEDEDSAYADKKQTTPSPIAITVSSDSTIAWWNFDEGKEQKRERLKHFAAIQNAAISLDGKFLACSATLNQRITKHWIWNLKTGESVAIKQMEDELIQYVAFANDAEQSVLITTSGLKDFVKKIWRWTPRNNELSQLQQTASKAGALWGTIATSNGENWLTFGGRGARMWKADTGIELMSYRPSSAIHAIAVSPDGHFLAACSEDGTTTLWNLQTKLAERRLVGGHSRPVLDVAFSPDGKTLGSTGADGALVTWDVSTGASIAKGFTSETKATGNSIEFSPDGKKIVLAAEDYAIRLYDSATLQVTQSFTGHTGAVNCISFSRDGRWLVSGSNDKTIRIWSVETSKEIARMSGHSAAIESVAFSNDGLRILSASQDGSTRIWDTDFSAKVTEDVLANQEIQTETNLTEILSLAFHGSEINEAFFSPDGRSIVTAGADGYAVVWPAEPVFPSIRLSRQSLPYRFGSGPLRLDPTALVSQPGAIDLRGATLTISPVDPFEPNESLSILSDDRIVLKENVVFYQIADQNPIIVGAVSNDNVNGMSILFSMEVTQSIVQILVRQVAYERSINSELGKNVGRTVQVSLLEKQKRTGNAVPESLTILCFN